MSVDMKEKYIRVYRYCYLRIKDRSLAEDLTQETFLRLLEHPQYCGEQDIRLLYTIAGNLCRDHFRQQAPEELPEEVPDLSSDVERLIDDISLHDALNSLSQQDRDMVLLRYVNGEPIGVISEITGMSRFAVSRRLKKVLGMLRKELEKEVVT